MSPCNLVMGKCDLINLYATLVEGCSPWKHAKNTKGIPLKNAEHIHLRNLKRIHARTVTLGISGNGFIQSKLVHSYASCSQLRQAYIIFSFTNRRTTFLFNSLIRAYYNLGFYAQSIYLFRQMLLAHIPFNRYTFPPLLKSCAKVEFWGPCSRLVNQIHGTIVVNGFASDLTISNALLFANTRWNTGCPAELLKHGRKLFDTILEKNVITWSTMMKDDQEVDKLFDRMIEAGERPNDVTFYAILRACKDNKRVEKGWEYFDMMEERFGLKPRVGHYAKMVDLLGWVGRVEEVAMLMLRMRREEVEPNETAWIRFRWSCYHHRKMELYELVEYILNYYETKARDQGKLPYRQTSTDDSMYGYSRYDVPGWGVLSMIMMIRSRKFLPIREDFLSSEYQRMLAAMQHIEEERCNYLSLFTPHLYLFSFGSARCFPGFPRLNQVTRCVCASKRTLCALSPEFFTSQWYLLKSRKRHEGLKMGLV